jgi:hypothetical protein
MRRHWRQYYVLSYGGRTPHLASACTAPKSNLNVGSKSSRSPFQVLADQLDIYRWSRSDQIGLVLYRSDQIRPPIWSKLTYSERWAAEYAIVTCGDDRQTPWARLPRGCHEADSPHFQHYSLTRRFHCPSSSATTEFDPATRNGLPTYVAYRDWLSQ